MRDVKDIEVLVDEVRRIHQAIIDAAREQPVKVVVVTDPDQIHWADVIPRWLDDAENIARELEAEGNAPGRAGVTGRVLRDLSERLFSACTRARTRARASQG